MIKVSVKNSEGKDVQELALSAGVFGLPKNDLLVHQIYVALMGNRRQAIAHTKDRSERAGSGKKPWRQKGTGRARVGSVRSPIWRKGGVTFGPTNERNFAKNTNKKMRQKAVMVALSDKVREGKLVILESLAFAKPEEQKTKFFAGVLKNLALARKGMTVGLLGDERESVRLMRNIPKVATIPVENLSVLELLHREYLVVTPAGIASLEKRFAGLAKEKEEKKTQTAGESPKASSKKAAKTTKKAVKKTVTKKA